MSYNFGAMSLKLSYQLMTAEELRATLDQMADDILKANDGRPVVLLGVQRRGVPMARRMAIRMTEKALREPQIGSLDINLYRDDLSRDEILEILDTADSLQEVSTRPIKKVPTLRGKTIINLFFEASTRTRTSFEIAAKRLSADVVNVSQSTSSVSKGETLIDTAKTLDAMAADCVVIRHFASGAPHTLAKLTKASIINAGDGAHEHPTQALLDAFTIRQRKGRLNDLRVAIIGDIAHSRVARSNLHL